MLQNTGHLVDVTPGEASDDVPDEEEAGDPGAAVEVDLYGVPGAGASHHLGDGHAGEGHPASHHRGAEGHCHGGEDLAGRFS